MKKSIRELLRDNLIWICFLGIALLFVGQFISSLIDPFPLPNYFNNNFKILMLGFLIGFVLNGFCALVAILHGDIKLTFYKFEILNLKHSIWATKSWNSS